MTKFCIAAKNITVKMRCIVVDYMIEVCYKSRLKDSTLHMAVILHDKYISSKKDIGGTSQYQKVALTSLIIASKLQEFSILGIEECINLSDNL